MTENDPLGIIESDERFLPKDYVKRAKSRGELFIEHMFGELFSEESDQNEE